MARLSTVLALAGGLTLSALGGQVQAQAPGPVSRIDAKFLGETAQGSAYELASAKLAAEKATRDDVKAYARRLVGDHEAYNSALAGLAQAKGVPLPAEMKAADAKRLARLERLSGPAFDKAYVAEAIRINAAGKRSTAREAKATKDGQIREFVQRFEAVDGEHDRMAMELRRTR